MTRVPSWDWLGQLKLALSLEEHFQIFIPEALLEGMTSVRDVCDVVRGCMTHH